MQWLDLVILIEAGAGFVLASMNCRYLLAYARAARTVARRTGATALALVSAALALEALAFLGWPALEASPELREAGLLAVRSALLVAAAVISVLLLRGARWPRT